MNALPVTWGQWAWSALPVLLDAAIKAAVLLLAASAVTAAMRKASASARQVVWVLALAGMLAMPALSAVLPAWNVLPDWARVDPPPAPAGQAGDVPPPAFAADLPPAPPPLADRLAGADWPGPLPPAGSDADAEADQTLSTAALQAAAQPPADRSDAASAGPAGRDWRAAWPWAMLVWVVGSVVCLGPLVLGRLSLWRLARRARRIDMDGESWGLLAQRVSRSLGLRRRVVLLMSDAEPMPMVWGILKPKLMLPAEADSWPMDRRRVVLLHELAHTRRHDCLAKLIAHLACAAYWFNPLCWVALRRMQIEAEAACDDLVLSTGHSSDALGAIRPSDYAQHLLEIASGLRAGMLAAYSSIAMARRSRLEGRLLAILDGHRNRRALTRLGVLAVGIVLVAVAVPLACIKAGSDKPAPPPRTGMTATTPDAPGTHPAAMTSADVAKYHREQTGEDLPPEALNKLYTDRAMQYAQTGGDPHELETAVRRALAFGQDESTLVQLQICLGDACWRQTTRYTPDVWRPQRVKAAQAYLDGLAIVLRHELPAQPPELPATNLYDIDGPPEEVERYRKQHEQEMAARKEAERVRQLVHFRQVLTGQIAQMYACQPDDFDQLHQLAMDCFDSEEVAAALVAGAKAYRADPHAPAVVLTLPASWGKVVSGLQAGLRWGTQNRVYHAGEQVDFVLVVRNVGDKVIAVVDFVPLGPIGPNVRTVDGKRLPVRTPAVGMPVKIRKTVLGPGETFEVGSVFLQLDVNPEERGLRPHVYLPPGKYLVSQTYRFFENKDITWSIELTTGDLTLPIATTPATPPAGPAKGMAGAGNGAFTRHFVRLVVGKDRMSFQGQDVTWEQLPALLEAAPDRAHTVLEHAMASDSASLKEHNDASGRVALLARRLGFAYASDIGIQSLGSMGSPSQHLPAAVPAAEAPPPPGSPATPLASEAPLNLARAQLRMQEERLNELEQLASGGRATERELREQQVKVLEAQTRIIELSEGAASEAVAQARLNLAKAQLRMQEERLNELEQLASGGRATARELREQEVKVLEARARLAELAGPGTIPATQPTTADPNR